MGFLSNFTFSETLEIISEEILAVGHPCSIKHKFLVFFTEFIIVFSSMGLIDLKSIISTEIFFVI